MVVIEPAPPTLVVILAFRVKQHTLVDHHHLRQVPEDGLFAQFPSNSRRRHRDGPTQDPHMAVLVATHPMRGHTIAMAHTPQTSTRPTLNWYGRIRASLCLLEAAFPLRRA